MMHSDHDSGGAYAPSPGGLVKTLQGTGLETGTPHNLDNETTSDDDLILTPLDGIVTVGDRLLNSDGDRVYRAVFRKRAGKMTVQVLRQSHLTPHAVATKQTPVGAVHLPNTSASRARRQVENYAVANSLVTVAMLTYDDTDYVDDPELCAHRYRLMMRRLKHKVGDIAWVEVQQRGKLGGRLHHHVLTSRLPDECRVTDFWPHGTVEERTCESVDDVRRSAIYLTRDFDLPIQHRLLAHRYRMSSVGREGLSGQVVIGTRQRLDAMLAAELPPGHKVKVYRPGVPHCDAVLTFDPPGNLHKKA